MNLQASFSAWLRRSGWLLLLIALVQFLLHTWANAHDNFFRDELYYMAAAQHLDFGYVDYPPFVALVAGLSRLLFGTSLVGIRLFPAEEAFSSPTVTAAYVPERCTWKALDASLRSYGMVVGANYDPLAGKVFPIGHMGSQADPALENQGMDVLAEVLRRGPV